MDDELGMFEADDACVFEGGADSVDTDPSCGICLEPVEERGEIRGCEHLFCFQCIEHWAKVHDPPTCPMCKQGFNEILKHPPVDPLDKLLGDEDDDELSQRPSPAVIKVGPQPRASRRRRQPAAQLESTEEEILEQVQQQEEVMPRTTRNSRARRQAARRNLREHEDLGVNEDEALAMALAASLADAPVSPGSQNQSTAQGTANGMESTVSANASTQRAPARRQAANADTTNTRTRSGARRGASRKRVVHVDPITGQRIRAPRFSRPTITASTVQAADESTNTAEVEGSVEVEESAERQDDETAGESDEEQPLAESLALENHRRARNEMVAERLSRNLAAPVAAPSPLRPWVQRRPTNAGSPRSPDLMSSPSESAADDSSTTSGQSASPPSDVEFQNESPSNTSTLDTSGGGEQDLMSRLQKRMRASKAFATARNPTTPLQQRDQNCHGSPQLADDM